MIRRMVADLNVPVEIVPVATVREADGLAVSSRNQYLDAEQRRIAPVVFRALREAERLIRAGEKDVAKVRESALGVLRDVRVEYLEIVDPEDMQPVATVTGPVRIAAAVWLGTTRLIDNILVEETRVG
ncbi:MAG: hypothetical protein DMG11_15780 [Acidobacteria bacterium]|nr:MAG: hypothetical protein DMG11_15780 [Acidobacteriota bacterium]